MSVLIIICSCDILHIYNYYVVVVDDDLLEFHPMCGAHTLVINNNTVAYRPK